VCGCAYVMPTFSLQKRMEKLSDPACFVASANPDGPACDLGHCKPYGSL
jgi:hypothetical protein